MKTLLASLVFFLLAPTSQSSACGVRPYLDADINHTPVSWAYQAMFENDICGKLLSMRTTSSGQNDRHHKFGKRDTIVIIPDVVKVGTSVDIIYWFHGLTGFKKKTFVTRLGPQYGWVLHVMRRPAVLVVVEMPWSRFTRTQWKRQGRVFRKKNEFLRYTQEVEARVSPHISSLSPKINFNRIIVGHSAGGSAIASAAQLGGLCAVDPVGVVFSDSTYGSWFRRSWNGCLKSLLTKGKARVLVLGQSFGAPWKAYSAWKRRNKISSHRIEAHRLPLPWTHARIGNNALPFYWHAFPGEKYKNLYGE